MTTVPAWAPAWLLARHSTEIGVILATVSNPIFETYRWVADTQAVVSRGQTFTPCPFQVDLVNDDGQVPRCQFKIPNVSPDIGRKLARATVPVEVRLDVISLAHPDEPVETAARLRLRNINLAPDFLTGELVGRDWSSEPYGTIMVVPSRFPALFRLLS